MKSLDIGIWNRKEHFDFFSKFDDPTYGIVSEVDCSRAYQTAKEYGHSFFAWYLHRSLTAVNNTVEFLYRVRNGEILVCDVAHASATIGRQDGTFGYSFIPFSTDFHVFNKGLQAEIDAVNLVFSSLGYPGRDPIGRFPVFSHPIYSGKRNRWIFQLVRRISRKACLFPPISSKINIYWTIGRPPVF